MALLCRLFGPKSPLLNDLAPSNALGDSLDTASEAAAPTAGQNAADQLSKLKLSDSSTDRERKEATAAAIAAASGSLDSFQCSTCGQRFDSLASQRSHYRSDWHRFNLQRKGRGMESLPEDEFESLVDQDEAGSISGSDSESDSDASDTDHDGMYDTAAPHASLAPLPEEEGGGGRRRGGATAQTAGRGPMLVFSAAGKEGEGVERFVGIHRPLLVGDGEEDPDPPTLSRRLSSLLSPSGLPSSKWAVLLAKGGHFAGAIYDFSKVVNTAQGQVEPGCAAHKSLHRYVIRAKQGGRQATKDATGKVAKSAGSALRRYNELQLASDIRQTLTDWREELAKCQIIWIQVSRADRPAFFGSGGEPGGIEGAALGRVRRVPFPTKRPTFSETKRTCLQLSSAFDLTEHVGARRGQEEAARAKQKEHEGKKKAAAAAAPSPSPLPAPAAPAPPLGKEGPLHRAAKAGDAAKVRDLLSRGHDPCQLDEKGKTPYGLTKDRDTRDEFRRAWRDQPDKWDWAASGVPSPMTEQEEKQREKERLKKEQKDREAAAAAAEAAAAAAPAPSGEDDVARILAELDAETKAKKQASSSKPGSKPAGGAAKGSKKVGSNITGPRTVGGGSTGAAPESAEERRKLAAEAAERRAKALQEASRQQKLY